jgi:hypothetical protein
MASQIHVQRANSVGSVSNEQPYNISLRDQPAISIASKPQYNKNIMLAADLSELEWFQIVRDNKILHGVVMGTKGINEDNGPEVAPYALVGISGSGLIEKVLICLAYR